MKDYRQLLKELPSNTLVCAVGDFDPPTIAHELLVKTVKRLAEQKKSDHLIFTSPSSLIQEEKKEQYLNLMFPKTKFKSLNETKIGIALKELSTKYKNIVIVSGSEQVTSFKKMVLENTSLEIIAINEKNPDASDTKMKSIASKGLYEEFKKKLPSTIRELDGRRLMNDVRVGMGLEPIKEQIVLVKNDLREKYFKGEIFNEGDIVESNGEKFTIVKRGSNHLLLKEASGNLVSKWIHDVKQTEEKEDMNEQLTDKTLRPNDKIKVARIIATMLGVENAETSSNPENLINSALRKVRSKALNPEALHILDKMLNLATEQGIQYDATLKPTKLKEAVKQIDGTDKISVTTDSPVVNKNSKYNFAKDVLRFNDFKKLKKVQEQDEPKADDKKDNESDHDYEHNIKVTDTSEVGHTLVSAGGQDNLRRRKVKYHLGEQAATTGMEVAKKIMKKGMTTYGKEGGHELTAQHIASDPEHTGKQKKLAQSFISKMTGSVAEEVKGGRDKEAMEIAKANLATKHAKEKESLSHKHQREKEALKEETVEICETADAGLAAKAKKSGISIGTLRKVYRRGVAAWNSGHRPGTTPQQWGMARVNSYITKGKGTYHGADKDLREEEELEQVNELNKSTLKSYLTKKMNKPGIPTQKDASGMANATVRLMGKKPTTEAKLPEVPKDKESGLPKKYVAGLSDATAKARAAHWDKMDKKSDSDPSAYEPAPGDATAKTKLSKHTLKYRAMFGEDMDEELYEACWSTHKQVGMKKKGDRMVPDCVPKNEEIEFKEEECEVCGKSPCECDDKIDSTTYNKPFDPFFKEDEDEIDFPEPSDEEIDGMADELSDDDYLDAYDEDELGIIDDETGEELEADEEEEKKLEESTLMEVLSRIERMKAKARIRRTKAKRERATKIALKRYSNTATINKRARRLAIKLMKKRLTRGRDVSKLSVGEKERIERFIERRKAIIGRIAMRLAPRVRKVEKARLSHTKYTQGSPNVTF